MPCGYELEAYLPPPTLTRLFHFQTFDLGQAISRNDELKVEEVRAHLWPKRPGQNFAVISPHILWTCNTILLLLVPRYSPHRTLL